MNIEKNKLIKKYMISLIVFSFGAFLYSFEGMMKVVNTTILAFTYKNGFAPSSLLGTLYQGLDDIIPINISSYKEVLHITLLVTIIIYFFLFVLAYRCFKVCEEKYLITMECLIYFFMVNTVTMFSSIWNLGRVDLYMLVLTVIAIYSIIVEKAQWITISCSALGMMFSTDYLFLYFNIILVLMIYRMLSSKKSVVKYGIIAGCNVLVTVGLYGWFHSFQYSDLSSTIMHINKRAMRLSRLKDDTYPYVLAYIQQMNGKYLSIEEHMKNVINLLLFIAFMIPFIMFGIKVFCHMIHSCFTRIEKVKYFIMGCGIFTFFPYLFTSVWIGKGIYAVAIYFCLLLIFAYLVGDKIIIESFERERLYVKRKFSWSVLFLAYPILFLPYSDDNICVLTRRFSEIINNFLNLW